MKKVLCCIVFVAIILSMMVIKTVSDYKKVMASTEPTATELAMEDVRHDVHDLTHLVW